MVTTESESSHLSEKAVSGFANAALYDAHRPSYPPEAVTKLVDVAAVSGLDGARIVDLAAGTGKFTELLAKRKEEFDILAVEPHDEMREQLARKGLKNVKVTDGLSTAIPAEDETMDAVFAAQVCARLSTLSSMSLGVVVGQYCRSRWFPASGDRWTGSIVQQHSETSAT